MCRSGGGTGFHGMAIAGSCRGWHGGPGTAIPRPTESGVEFALDQGFDPVPKPLAHTRLDRNDPIVEKSGFGLAGQMCRVRLADEVRHGVVSCGTGVLQRPNPAVWVAAPGDYATLSKAYHFLDGTDFEGLHLQLAVAWVFTSLMLRNDLLCFVERSALLL